MKDDKNQKEINYLKERLRMFDGTSASGFKGFSGANALNQNLGVTSSNMNTIA